MSADVSHILKSAGASLEAEAFKQFGAAVENASNSALGSIFGANTQQGIQPGSAAEAVQNIEPGVWDSPKYSAQLVSNQVGGSFTNAPKLKFLFKVSFTFDPAIMSYASELGIDTDELTRMLDYSVKQVDLPKVDFEYEEVNMYNFRTKILKQIKHREINLTFYDDNGNRALNLINMYRMLHQPVSRVKQNSSFAFKDNGMSFNDSIGAPNSAHRGVLTGGITNVLTQIVIHQYYTDLSSHVSPIKVNEFVFTNPRITNVDVSDQDHEQGGAANMIAIIFDFDALHIATGKDPRWSDTRPTSVMTYDILSNYQEGPATIKRGNEIGPGATRNPLVDIIARQGQRAVQTAVAGAMRDAVGNTSAGRALSGAIGSISGAFGTAAGNTLGNVASGAGSFFSKPYTVPLKDNSASESQVMDLTNQIR